jgi:hypothetical protein
MLNLLFDHGIFGCSDSFEILFYFNLNVPWAWSTDMTWSTTNMIWSYLKLINRCICLSHRVSIIQLSSWLIVNHFSLINHCLLVSKNHRLTRATVLTGLIFKHHLGSVSDPKSSCCVPMVIKVGGWMFTCSWSHPISIGWFSHWGFSNCLKVTTWASRSLRSLTLHRPLDDHCCHFRRTSWSLNSSYHVYTTHIWCTLTKTQILLV